VTLTEDQLRARFPNASEAFLRANGHLPPLSPAPAPDRPSTAKEQPAKKRIRQSAKPLLNKLETEFLAYLRGQFPDAPIHAQAFRFRLANGLHYTPDLVVWADGWLTCYEVKGPHAFRGGFENLKSAANRFVEIAWRLAWKESGRWQIQQVLP
jgi:hypothetical protein